MSRFIVIQHRGSLPVTIDEVAIVEAVNADAAKSTYAFDKHLAESAKELLAVEDLSKILISKKHYFSDDIKRLTKF